MPYKFGEYVSTYVDPQSVAISETLRNRFMENFKANDNLTMAVEQMKAALPFENDMAKKKELEGKINSTLETLSTRGDYENLGFAVHKAAKDFSMGYAPIKENYERYQGALKDLDEKYKKGDINAEDYNMATSYITKGYKGFEMDPATGKVKEGTMYSSPTIYNDPKLMDKMKERLEILYEKKTGSKSGTAGLDANGAWKITQGSTHVEIPEQDVMDVYNAVIEEPDVRMYLDQRADMKLHMVDKSGNTGKYLDAKMQTNSAAIQQINEAIASGKYSAADKKTLATQIEALTKENEQLTAAKADPNLATSYLKDQFRNDLLDPVRQYAMKKAGVREHTTEYSYENNYAIQLDAIKRRQDKLDALGESLYRTGDVTADKDISGSNTKEKEEFIKNADKQIANLENQLKNTSLSKAAKDDLEAAIITAKRDKERAQNQIRDAANKGISMADLEKQDPTLIGIFKDKMKGASSGDIYAAIQKTFDNIGDQDYIEFKAVFDGKYGKGALDKHIVQYYGGSTSDREAIKRAHPNVTDAELDSKGILNSPTRLINTFKKFEPKINEKYVEVKEARLYGERIQTGNDDLDIEVTKQVKDFFVGRPITQNEVVRLDGKEMNGAEIAALEQDYKVNKVFWHAGSNTYELDLVGKDGNVKTVTMDGRRLQGTGLSEAMSRPSVRLGAAVMAQNSHDANSAPRYLRDITLNGAPVQIKITSRGDDNPYISFEHPDGRPFLKDKEGKPLNRTYKLDDPEVKELLESNVVIKGI